MKILFVNNDLEAFLAHRHWFARRLARDGHSIMLASGGNCCAKDRLDPQIRYVHLDLDPHKLRFRRDLALVRQFRKLIHDFQPDLVHTFTAKPNLFMALALLSKKGSGTSSPGLVMTFPGLGKIFEPANGAGKSMRRRMVSSVFRRAARKLAMRATFENEQDRAHFVNEGIFSNDRSEAVFGAGINLNEFSPIAKPSERPVFLYAGRMLRAKGVDSFVHAANSVVPGESEAGFHVAGEIDPTNPDCFDVAAEAEAGRLGRVKYLGSFSPSDMATLYGCGQVLVLPTRLQEGFPRSLIEAAACGLALIASDQASVRQIVYPGENGWLVDANNHESLRQAMQEAIDKPDLVAAFQKRSAELAITLPVGEDVVFDRFVGVYKACLSEANAG